MSADAVLVCTLVVVLLCTLVVVTAASAGTSSGKTLLQPSAKVVATIAIPAGEGALAVGEGAVWAVSDSGPVLSRIDPSRNAVTARVKFRLNKTCPVQVAGCGEAAAGDGAVWVSHLDDNSVARIDPQTGAVKATIKVGYSPRGVAVSPGAVWIANGGDVGPGHGPSVSRIDPSTNKVVATIRLASSLYATDRMSVSATSNAVWVTLTTRNAVIRIDPKTNKPSATIALPYKRSGQPCGFIIASQGVVWVSDAHCPGPSGSGTVTRIDPKTNTVATVAPGFKSPIGLAFGSRSLWVADLDAKAIDRVNPVSGQIITRVPVGGQPIRLGFGFGAVWVRDDSGRVLRMSP